MEHAFHVLHTLLQKSFRFVWSAVSTEFALQCGDGDDDDDDDVDDDDDDVDVDDDDDDDDDFLRGFLQRRTRSLRIDGD